MSSSKPVSLIFGAGPGIGAALVTRFLSAGYNVGTVSRSARANSSPDVLSIQADLSVPSSVSEIFSKVKSTFGVVPSVVVYNVANLSPGTEPGNMFSIGDEALQKDISLMVGTPFAVAREAYKGWEEEDTKVGSEGEKKKRTFIYTGNILPKVVVPVADLTTLGVGKSGAAYWVQEADLLYKAKGWRFFFAEERTPEGGPMGTTPGPESHAEMYLKLAEGKEAEMPSYVTFVKDRGYVAF